MLFFAESLKYFSLTSKTGCFSTPATSIRSSICISPFVLSYLDLVQCVWYSGLGECFLFVKNVICFKFWKKRFSLWPSNTILFTKTASSSKCPILGQWHHWCNFRNNPILILTKLISSFYVLGFFFFHKARTDTGGLIKQNMELGAVF